MSLIFTQQTSVDKITVTTADFAMPAVAATVVVSVDTNTPYTTNWISPGLLVFIENCGYMEVTAYAAGSMTVENTGASQNVAPTTNVVTGATVQPVGNIPSGGGGPGAFAALPIGGGDFNNGTPNAFYRKNNDTLELKGHLEEGSAIGYTTEVHTIVPAGGMPAGFRPSEDKLADCISVHGGQDGVIEIKTDGSILLRGDIKGINATEINLDPAEIEIT